MNALGYDFPGNSNAYYLPGQLFFKQALETFKTDEALFPNSWNAYNSCAGHFCPMARKRKP
ncbi:hypothetical protein AAFN85_03425 [Mucilaginibacter sp. CAU 1740]|uniref:hypothetical protein n=1 Tax=Mucilaginibacter sp. CAU 1740 TaxID=3140365 RepID=UPI00325B6C0B